MEHKELTPKQLERLAKMLGVLYIEWFEHQHGYCAKVSERAYEMVTLEHIAQAVAKLPDEVRIEYYRNVMVYHFSLVKHSNGQPSMYVRLEDLDALNNATVPERLEALDKVLEG